MITGDRIHPKHRREFFSALANHKWERTSAGFFLPQQKLAVGGVYYHNVNGGPDVADPNLVVDQGLNSILDVVFHASSQIATWYVAPYSGNVSPATTWTAANFTANSTETQAQYDEATRQEWVEAASSSESIGNTANKAAFTMNTTVTVYGAGLISVSTKGAATGTLMSATKFAAQRDLVNTDVFNIGYVINISST